MRSDNIVCHSEVVDEWGQIIPKFVSLDGSDWVPHGQYIVVRENGCRLLEITYDHGVPHGPFRDFWSNGKVGSEGKYHKGKREGVWHFYDVDGSLDETVEFKDDKEIRYFPFDVTT